MARTIGTVVRGVRAPIVKEGEDIVEIVVNSLLEAQAEAKFNFYDKDVVGVTESIVARTQGNYASIHDIATDISSKFTGDSLVVVFPILSRNRFSLLLKGIALSKKKIYLMLNYPSDEVGNSLMQVELMDDADVNPHTDVLDESAYRKIFGQEVKHPFTGIDYVAYYKSLAEDNNIEIILANDPRVALNYSKDVLVANIHERYRTKRILKNAGAHVVYSLDQILDKSINGSGYNPECGLLGSNKATEEKVKLFPRDCQPIVDAIQDQLLAKTGKKIEVMVYGDGAFKDPVGHIWELADPVVSPAYTVGLAGQPNEIKIKYIADTELVHLSKGELAQAMREKIMSKDSDLTAKDASLGTTPRQLTDLLGSLCDLTSGSGDKGTPIILVQGYFDNYASE